MQMYPVYSTVHAVSRHPQQTKEKPYLGWSKGASKSWGRTSTQLCSERRVSGSCPLHCWSQSAPNPADPPYL